MTPWPCARPPVHNYDRTVPSSDFIARAPKALLHDHLDGGVRPRTVVELADEFGYGGLPTHDVAELSTWFNRGA